ncbi:MAG: winged helix DNA-binding domain-containing protein [Oscillospiraceae bacterium]|nr:winged helix DNA-binding domain-containing protein [Oscillospiraceae bacterium]
MLLKHGLLGKHKFIGKQGALNFIRQAGCVQYDPVDVCGRSADIALNARVKNYSKELLDELLYKDRSLIDHFDKNLSIFAVEDIPAIFYKKPGVGYAEAYDRLGGEAVRQIEPLIRQLITERGNISSAEVGIDETIEWHWGVLTSLPRAALESMYFRWELIIHHKTGSNKSYAFMKDYIPEEILNAPPPFNSDGERFAWHIRRRIGAVGMLWNRASDAWLGLRIKTPERNAAFETLLGGGMIFEVAVEGLNDALYIREDDRAVLETVLSVGEFFPRCELIAPLDSLIWDRKLVKALFGFEYKWEIYTPADKRKYGAYVLPILYGERFIGRVEAICDRKSNTLIVKNVWYEDSVKRAKKMQDAINNCLKRFSIFNGCECIQGLSQ